MNKRIKLLIEQATTYIDPIANDGVCWDFDREKYAKLIVRECLELCQYESEDYDDQFDLGRVHQAKEITHLIKKHFGVEE
jgi:hypothetical protein